MHLKHYILSFDEVKKEPNKKLSKVKEEAKKAVDKVNIANALVKATEAKRDVVMAQKK